MSFIPTYLYIKQHAVTGLLYFGMTRQDPISYLGSGDYWKRHIKKHGREHVVTLWYELFTDRDEISEFAINFSKSMRIVESNQWANLIDETGVNSINGMLGKRHSTQSIAQIKAGNLGRIVSSETRSKLSLKRKLRVTTEETKHRMSAALRGRPTEKLTCPHCHHIGQSNAMYRWHFDNCKFIIVSLE